MVFERYNHAPLRSFGGACFSPARAFRDKRTHRECVRLSHSDQAVSGPKPAVRLPYAAFEFIDRLCLREVFLATVKRRAHEPSGDCVQKITKHDFIRPTMSITFRIAQPWR